MSFSFLRFTDRGESHSPGGRRPAPQSSSHGARSIRYGLLGLWAALVLVLGCEQAVAPQDPDSMNLELVRPGNTLGVYLNEPLVFDFSHEVDRASVTKRSLRIELADGTPARGEIRVEGQRVTFEPAAVLSKDLRDGGYLPGLRYTVTLLGFPAPNSLRGVGGEPLAQTKNFTFRTVKDVSWPRANFVFADDTPERCSSLFVLRDHVAPNESILLGCKEPLDPSTLFAEDFVLRGERNSEPIALRVRLIRNGKARTYAESDSPRKAAAVVELTPLGSLEEARRYTLEGKLNARAQRGSIGLPNLSLSILSDTRLADFSGNPVPLLRAQNFDIYIEDESPETDQFRESFVSIERRLPIPIEGLEGTALWSDEGPFAGRVVVRYPHAAGSGEDGDLVFGESGSEAAEERLDLHSTSLTVGTAGLQLASSSGLCVLRSQGRMVINGPLRRTTNVDVAPMRWRLVEEPGFSANAWLAEVSTFSENDAWAELAAIYSESGQIPNWNDLRDWFELARQELLSPAWADLDSLEASARQAEVRAWAKRVTSPDVPSPTLTAWLEKARSSNENWTVLIAGGDLVLHGSIESDTPLLLVAGGMIRITGDVRAGRLSRASNEELYFLGAGGGGTIQRRNAQLEIDAPQYNRLVRPISFGVLSKQIPQEDGPIEWASALEVVGASPGRFAGSLTVSYVRDVPALVFDPSSAQLFADPSLMDGAGPVHFFIRFDIPKAPDSDLRGLAPWSLPFLDEIILTAK